MHFDLYYKEDEYYRLERVNRPTTLYDTCYKDMPHYVSFYNGYTHITLFTRDATLEDIENFIDTILAAVT